MSRTSGKIIAALYNLIGTAAGTGSLARNKEAIGHKERLDDAKLGRARWNLI